MKDDRAQLALILALFATLAEPVAGVARPLADATTPAASAPPVPAAPGLAATNATSSDVAIADPGSDEAKLKRNQKRRTAATAGICAAGMILGGVFGGKTGFAVGAGLCALRVGWNLALNKKDKEALTLRSRDLLEQEGSHEETWTAPESGKQVTISTSAAAPEEHQVDFKLDQSVENPSMGTQVVGKTYVVVAPRLNFRTSPSSISDANLRGYFERDENVEVVGLTADGKWALVGDHGVVVGYASLRTDTSELLVTPERAEAIREEVRRTAQAAVAKRKGDGGRRAKPAPATIETAAPAPAQKPRAQPKMLAQVSSPLGTPRDASALTHVVKVSAQTSCKAVIARLGTQTDTKKGCVQSDGSWAIT